MDHDAIVTTRILVETYDAYDNPWTVVDQYHRLLEYTGKHPNKGSYAFSKALDLPRSRIRAWVDGENPGRPDCVRGLQVAEEGVIQRFTYPLFAPPIRSIEWFICAPRILTRMPGAAFLKGTTLTLRTIESADYRFIHEHWNDPDIRYSTPMPTPISEDGIAYFVEETDDAIQFLPCHDGTPVGFVMLFNIQREEDHANLAYWIIPDERGNGYATEAADLCLKHAFDDRGLHRVVARVFENNDASIRVLEKLGFEREGFLREHSYVNGAHRNMHLYGILASER